MSVSIQCNVAADGPPTWPGTNDNPTWFYPVVYPIGRTTVTMNWNVAQMAPITTSYCLAVGAFTDDGSGTTAVSNTLSATTQPDPGTEITPNISMNFGQPATCSSPSTCYTPSYANSYNYQNYCGSGCGSDSGDTRVCTALTSSSALCSFNDGYGPNNGSGAGYNVGLEVVSLTNGIVTGANLRNGFYDPTFPSLGYGYWAETNIPSGWSDGLVWKNFIPHCETATNCFASVARQQDSGSFLTGWSTIIRSLDQFATGFNPADLPSAATSGGDPPPNASTGIMWPSGGFNSNAGRMIVWISSLQDALGNITNPIDGLDTYTYAVFENETTRHYALGRIAKGLALGFSSAAGTGWQDATKWEWFVGTAGAGQENLRSAWQAGSAGLTASTNIGSPWGFWNSLIYVPALTSYIGITPGPIYIVTAPSLTGPYTLAAQQPGDGPFAGSPWNAASGAGCSEVWANFLPDSYNPSTGLATIIYTCAYDDQPDIGTVSQTNLYSTISQLVVIATPTPSPTPTPTPTPTP